MTTIRLLVFLFGCGDDAANDPCAGVTCSDHGECVPDGSAARCACDPGFEAAGLQCLPEGGDSDSDVDTDSDTDCTDADGDGADVCADADCDDSDESVHPGATDTLGDGIDQNCDDLDGVDADGDLHASLDSGGDDCEDAAVDVHPGAAEDDEWATEDIYLSHGSDVRLAVSADGFAHLAFWTGSSELRYASNERGGWGFNFVDYGERPSIALDPDGEPFITFYDGYDQDLELAYRTGPKGAESWNTRTLLDAEDVGRASSVAIDGGGQARLAYEASTLGDVNRASFDLPDGGLGIEWWYDGPPLVSGFSPSLCLTPAGEERIAIFEANSRTLQYAESASSWLVIAGDGVVGLSPSIACGSDGLARISYFDDTNDQIDFSSQNADTSWNHEPLHDDAGAGAHALALDPDDVAYVVFQADDRRVWWGYQADGDWQMSILEDDPDQGDSVAIAVADDHVHAAYGSLRRNSVIYAKRGLPDGIDTDCDGQD